MRNLLETDWQLLVSTAWHQWPSLTTASEVTTEGGIEMRLLLLLLLSWTVTVTVTVTLVLSTGRSQADSRSHCVDRLTNLRLWLLVMIMMIAIYRISMEHDVIVKKLTELQQTRLKSWPLVDVWCSDAAANNIIGVKYAWRVVCKFMEISSWRCRRL